MNRNTVGVDLGTSAVKVLQVFEDGTVVKQREPYTKPLPEGWWDALERALCRLDLKQTDGIGLASQVGTYVLDGETVIGWNSPAGIEEIETARGLCTPEKFDAEICMRHPHIISYPVPRFLYIKKHYPDTKEICQPKEWLLRRLTGEYATDPYSWRGLARLPEGIYSSILLEKTGVDASMLPPVRQFDAEAGRTLCIQCEYGSIPAGIPVYTGLNDFFSSLLGMGMREDLLFDITGTSEHLGIIDGTYHPEDKMVSGPWLRGYARYGVTASAGPSLDFCGRLDRSLFLCGSSDEAEKHMERMQKSKPPVFLPYLNGERAPIWDPNACGVFFGMNADTDRAELTYAVMEGVCFSLLHIFEALGKPFGKEMRLSGGASVNPLLNLLKTELLGIPTAALKENDTTALGAAILAMKGSGLCGDIFEASQAIVRTGTPIEPSGKYGDWLAERFGIYKKLYPNLRDTMNEWRKL